jgi:hypothetical protein
MEIYYTSILQDILETTPSDCITFYQSYFPERGMNGECVFYAVFRNKNTIAAFTVKRKPKQNDLSETDKQIYAWP